MPIYEFNLSIQVDVERGNSAPLSKPAKSQAFDQESAVYALPQSLVDPSIIPQSDDGGLPPDNIADSVPTSMSDLTSQLQEAIPGNHNSGDTVQDDSPIFTPHLDASIPLVPETDLLLAPAPPAILQNVPELRDLGTSATQIPAIESSFVSAPAAGLEGGPEEIFNLSVVSVVPAATLHTPTPTAVKGLPTDNTVLLSVSGSSPTLAPPATLDTTISDTPAPAISSSSVPALAPHVVVPELDNSTTSTIPVQPSNAPAPAALVEVPKPGIPDISTILVPIMEPSPASAPADINAPQMEVSATSVFPVLPIEPSLVTESSALADVPKPRVSDIPTASISPPLSLLAPTSELPETEINDVEDGSGPQSRVDNNIRSTSDILMTADKVDCSDSDPQNANQDRETSPQSPMIVDEVHPPLVTNDEGLQATEPVKPNASAIFELVYHSTHLLLLDLGREGA